MPEINKLLREFLGAYKVDKSLQCPKCGNNNEVLYTEGAEGTFAWWCSRGCYDG